MAQIKKHHKRQLSRLKSDIVRDRQVERCYREHTPPQIREKRRKYWRAKAPVYISLETGIVAVSGPHGPTGAQVDRAEALRDLRDSYIGRTW